MINRETKNERDNCTKTFIYTIAMFRDVDHLITSLFTLWKESKFLIKDYKEVKMYTVDVYIS